MKATHGHDHATSAESVVLRQFRLPIFAQRSGINGRWQHEFSPMDGMPFREAIEREAADRYGGIDGSYMRPSQPAGALPRLDSVNHQSHLAAAANPRNASQWEQVDMTAHNQI